MKTKGFITIVFSMIVGGVFLMTALAAGDSQWRQLSSMPVPRSEIYAAVLGDDIYVAGGIARFRTSRACAVLNVETEAWRRCPNLPRALHHVAMASHDGKIYASGGFSGLPFRFDPKAALWALSPGEKTWTPVAALPESRGEHVMASVNGRLFLFGGRTPEGDSDAVLEFDVAEKNWLPRAPMPVARRSMAAVILEDEVWLLGGRSAALGSQMASVDVYNPQTDEWRSAPAMPVGRGGHAAAVLDGRIHVFGGEVFNPTRLLDRHDVFDPATVEWTAADPSPKARHGAAAAEVGGEIYLIGGGARPAFQTIFSVSGTTQVWWGDEDQ